MDAHRLNRATLSRQLLLGRVDLDDHGPAGDRTGGLAAVVRCLVAIQGQEPASPYLALWNRVNGFRAEALDVAFARREVIRASLMRITLHVIAGDDYPAFHAAMTPSLRASRLGDRRFTTAAADPAVLDAAIAELLDAADTNGAAMTGAEIETFLIDRVGVDHPGLWWATKTFAPLHHAPRPLPWAFRPPHAYLAAHRPAHAGDHHAAVCALIEAYLRGFGPATMRDVEQFTLLRRPVVTAAFETLTLRPADPIIHVAGPDRQLYFDIPDPPPTDSDTPAPPRLLPMWDSVLFAYADRSRIIPDEFRPYVIRRNGNALATLLVDGYVAGIWRALPAGIEATAFRPLSNDVWERLDTEARALRSFLADRDPAVYSHYRSWWNQPLPIAERRIIGA